MANHDSTAMTAGMFGMRGQNTKKYKEKTTIAIVQMSGPIGFQHYFVVMIHNSDRLYRFCNYNFKLHQVLQQFL